MPFGEIWDLEIWTREHAYNIYILTFASAIQIQPPNSFLAIWVHLSEMKHSE